MNALETIRVQCPYCGERIETLIDCSAGEQTYVEDCSVCCAPVVFDVRFEETGELDVRVARENE